MEEILRAVGPYATLILVVNTAVLLGAVLVGWKWLAGSGAPVVRWAGMTRAALASVPPVASLGRRLPRLRRFLAGRFSPEGHLGIHATTGFVLLVTAVLLFALLARAVGGNTELSRFDLTLANLLHEDTSRRSVSLLDRDLAGSRLGADRAGCGNRGGIDRSSPAAVSRSGGHAMGAVFAYGMLVYLLILAIPSRWHSVVVAFGVGLIVLIGASRVYLGVHYFSDVIAGFAAGTAWLAVCVTATEVARRRPRGRRASAPAPLTVPVDGE